MLERLQAAQSQGDIAMPLTRDFKKTIQARIEKDPAFRDELLREGVECLFFGELETGKAILRDYINATIGFEKLSGLTHKSAKSLMRMLSPKGNPQARNLFAVIALLQKTGGLRLELALKHGQHSQGFSAASRNKKAS
jgi:DNA-binding phage protein